MLIVSWEVLIIGAMVFILMFQNTLLLRAIPGLNELGKALLGNTHKLILTYG